MKLLIAGDQEDDAVIRMFCEKSRWPVKIHGNLSDAVSDSLEGDWVLHCFVPGFSEVGDALHAFRGRGASTVLYARKRPCHPDLALQWCARHGVPWVFDESEEQHEARADLRRRVDDLLAVEPLCPAPKILLTTKESSDIRGKGTGFVVSRFADEYLGQIEKPIRCAGKYHDLKIAPANRQVASKHLSSSVLERIRDSGLVIADVTQSRKRKEKDNPNVYLEIGFAMALEKRVILIHDARQGLYEPPTDMQGLPRIAYWGPVDLALQLYFGLKQGFDESGT